MKPDEPNNARNNPSPKPAELRTNYHKIERREWWLWLTAGVITLLLTAALVSFFLPGGPAHENHSLADMPQAMRGLVGLVLLFDLYVIYQHMQIHRIRRQLIEREKLFQLISENAADMIAIVDLEGRRIYNSLSYQKILGHSPQELQDSSAFEQIHPEDRERVRQAAEEARRTGVGRTLEYRFRHKNGEWLTLESAASVIRDARGEPEKLLIVNRNVTERKHAEEALSSSEAGFRSLVEGAPYGIYRAANGRFLQVNPALQRMLGYQAAEELLQMDLARQVFRHSGEYTRMNDLLTHGEKTKEIELDWIRRDGKIITVRCSGHRVLDKTCDAECVEVYAEDVTEKRVLERQLQMAQKMEAIGRLSGGIAHDFNNLLGVILGYAGVLKKNLGEDKRAQEYALEIEKAGRSAASLIRQLLAFSRQQVMSPTDLNLNTMISDMDKMVRRLLGEDITVSLALHPELGSVQADPSQIQQVILNLAANARDAMPRGGMLEIETRNVELDESYTRDHAGSSAGEYVLLAIRDTGTGMSPEVVAHIFEPFFTTKEVGKGTGLGLATVYGIVKQSRGYIWVDSAPGKGSTFQIYLPRHGGAEVTSAGKPPTEALEKSRGSETVLLVEDSEPLRNLARSFLEAHGYRVLAAGGGEEALEAAARHPGIIDMLVTDVVMPGINGRVLAERLAARQPGLKVLFISGYTDAFIAGHGVLQPGTNLLHKPFSEEAFLNKVREVLQSGASPHGEQNNDLQPAKAG